MPEGDSFLPRIQSVFYAVFDDRQGPKIVYQVPEALIGVPPVPPNTSVPPTPTSDSPVIPNAPPSAPFMRSRNSSNSFLISPIETRSSGGLIPSSPQKRSSSVLFNFDDISKYVIPPTALCGRLVICSTKRHQIIGFPVALIGKYKRYYFRYNICFVFERSADLSCYEPIVRKISRVLTSCEEESGFLSSVHTSPTIHAILEQLYEDLNSYAETSITIDQFNSIELKIFPFYPNPPAVRDWMVPLALINLTKRIEDNWDLTMVKVCKYIDGTNHVARIASLADCDLMLTRQAIAHLLFYQVIMTIDIFQYSNMYTLRKSIQWLADQPHVREECGPYVTRPGHPVPDWPKLLYLYSRLKPGKSIAEWMDAYGVHHLGIDVRRFTSFGVIKGFLRRVHRWPILLPPSPGHTTENPFDVGSASVRRRGNSFSTDALQRPMAANAVIHGKTTYTPSPPFSELPQYLLRGRSPQTLATHTTTSGPSNVALPTLSPDNAVSTPTTPVDPYAPSLSATHRARRASAAEKVLEQLRSRDIQKTNVTGVGTLPGIASPRTSWLHYTRDKDRDKQNPQHHQHQHPNITDANHRQSSGEEVVTVKTPPPHIVGGMVIGVVHDSPTKLSTQVSGGRASAAPSRRQSLINPPGAPPPSPVMSKGLLLPSAGPMGSGGNLTTPSRKRLSRSPSVPNMSMNAGQSGFSGVKGSATGGGGQPLPFPVELIPLLDGEHHTDELSVKFQTGWPVLEQWLTAIGGGKGGKGDYGRVVVICR